MWLVTCNESHAAPVRVSRRNPPHPLLMDATPTSSERDWSWPYAWFEEAAALDAAGHHVNAEITERIAMGGVEGSCEYLALIEDDDDA